MPRWAAPVALVVAVVALALAIWALLSESSNTPATALPGDPKTRVCTAFETVSKAVPLQTNNDLGPEPVAQAAVAANARLALFGGGQYLLNSLDSATPEELADAVRLFATNLRDIGMNALAGAKNSDPDQVIRMAEVDTTRHLIADLCK
jgi:L-alanine-DL-glutamate epimerase-like enolase superfamily enzyme